MKKMLFLLLSVSYSYCSISQMLSNYPGPNGMIRVVPIYEYHSTGIPGLFDPGTYKIVPRTERSAWVKRLNSGYRHMYKEWKKEDRHLGTSKKDLNWAKHLEQTSEEQNYVILYEDEYDTSAFVLIPRAIQESLDKRIVNYSGVNQQDLPEVDDRQMNLFQQEVALSKDRFHNVNVNIKTGLRNIYGININKVLANHKVDNGKLLNGKVSLQFYDSVQQKPVAYYEGLMKDGVPDGYGFFLKAYKYHDKNLAMNTQNDKIVFYVRKGYWKNGAFEKEAEAKKILDSTITNLETIGDIGLKGNAPGTEVELINASYEKDSLNPGTTNTFALKALLKWKISADTKTEDRYIYYSMVFKDFFIDEPKYEFLGADSVTENILFKESKKDKKTGIADIFESAKALTNKFAKTNYVSNYLKAYQGFATMPFDNRPCFNDQFTLTDYYTEVEVSTRSAKDAEWDLFGTFTIVNKHEDCYHPDDVEYYVQAAYGLSFPESFPTNSAAVHAIISEVKKIKPDPINDPSISKIDSVRGEKWEEIKKRFSENKMYPFNPSDPLQGIWCDDRNENIYLIRHITDTVLLRISKESVSPKRNYLKEVLLLNCSKMSDKAIIIHSHVYKSEFFNSPATGSNLQAEWFIRNLSKSSIRFSDTRGWNRLSKP